MTQATRLKLLVSYYLDYPLVQPKTCSINVTGRCNSKCVYCKSWRASRSQEKTLGELNALLEQLKLLGVQDILLSGGEPFLRRDILDIVVSSVRLGFMTRIVTNGSCCSHDDLYALAELGIARVGVSLDAIDPRRYQAIRGIGIERTLETLQTLRRVHDEHPSLQVVLYSTIHSLSIPDILPLAEFAKENGFWSYFQPVQKVPEVEGQVYDKIWPDDHEAQALEEVMRVLVEMKRRSYPIINTEGYLGSIPPYFRQHTFFPAECFAAYDRINIDSDMGVRPCWMMPPVAYADMKNIREIWFSKAMRDTRKLIRHQQCPGCLFNCNLDRKYVHH